MKEVTGNVETRIIARKYELCSKHIRQRELTYINRTTWAMFQRFVAVSVQLCADMY